MSENKTKSRIPLISIRTDGGTQMRVAFDEGLIAEYADAMRNGEQFPALVVYFDGTDYWLADGFHRLAAAREAEFSNVECHVIKGTVDDARWAAIGANAHHGLRRTNADKRRAVQEALRHPHAQQLSARQIAKQCEVSHSYVVKIQKELAVNVYSGEPVPGSIAAETESSRLAPATNAWGLPKLEPGKCYRCVSPNRDQLAEIWPHPDSPEHVLLWVSGPRSEVRYTSRGVTRDIERIGWFLNEFGFTASASTLWTSVDFDGEWPSWFPSPQEAGKANRAKTLFELKHGEFPSLDDDTYWGVPEPGALRLPV